MTARRKSKSAQRTKGGAALKLRRRGRGKEEDEAEEVESSEVLPHYTPPPPPHLSLPLTPNTSLLDLTVTYDYRASAVGEGPDKTIEELSAMFAFKDSPVGRPSLLPLCSDLGCSPQLPARKRPRMTLPLSTASPPQQSRFQRLEWLAGQLHQRLSEDHTSLTSPQPHQDLTSVTSPHTYQDLTSVTSPHPHQDLTSVTSPHTYQDLTSVTSPQPHKGPISITPPQPHKGPSCVTPPHPHKGPTSITPPYPHNDHTTYCTNQLAGLMDDDEEDDENIFWSQAADVVALWEDTSPPKPSSPKPSPSPDPFGDSDAEAFIDQLLSDGHLETPAKSCAQRWATHQPALDNIAMDDKMEGGCNQDNIAMDDKMEGGCNQDKMEGGCNQDKMEGGCNQDNIAMDDKMEGGCNQDKMEGGCNQDKMEGGCNQDRATHQPTMKTDDMTVDRHTVEGTGNSRENGRGKSTTEGLPDTHKGAVKCSQVEIERKRELARLRRAQRSKWKAEPAISS